MTRIAIIGAGLAGMTLARELAAAADIVVFEKSRGAGGRMATRSATPFEFDHGAQFFTARSLAFRTAVADWEQAGIVERWYPHFVELDRERVMARRDWDDEHLHYVGVPNMQAIGRHLATDVDIRFATAVASINRQSDGWQLATDQNTDLGTYDWVISTAPAAQSAALLPDEFAYRQQLQNFSMLGCYAVMLGFSEAPPLGWQAALVHNADISWVSMNSSKPGRDAPCTFVVHSTNAFAEAHIDDAIEDIKAHLLTEIETVTGIDVSSADHFGIHRWRYANIEPQTGPAAWLDTDQQLGACGDWCIRGRVEAAFSSATALSRELRSAL